MSEEELKAIEWFKYCEIEVAQRGIENIKKDAEKNKIPYKNIEGYIESFNDNIRKAKTILNLIEKQQKEIEKLRIKNGKEFVRGMETNEKAWKAKIRSKIKELEEQATISQGEELLIIDAKIDMLEELLKGGKK